MSHYDPRYNVFSGEEGGIKALYDPDVAPPPAVSTFDTFRGASAHEANLARRAAP